MDQRAILDNGPMPDPLPPDSLQREWPGVRSAEASASGDVKFPGEDGGKSLAELAQRDLVATLQLLTERAQYITGATGAAIALRDGTEMTCRASAGTCAPEVGAQLQVDSGLSGESVRTKQTLRCDDAAVDPRVNRESCEALGIASVVVMPLVQGSAVIGVFELFSDKAHAFEARDIAALERMGAMVFTALENALAALKDVAAAAIAPSQHPETALQIPPPSAPAATAPDGALEKDASVISETSATPSPEQTVTAVSDAPVSDGPVIVPGSTGFTFHADPHAASPVNTAPVTEIPSAPPQEDDLADILEEPAGPVMIPGIKQSASPQTLEDAPSPVEADILESDTGVAKSEAEPAPVQAAETPGAPPQESAAAQAGEPPSEVAGLRRCEHCGFPVSEGRQLCLDCDRKAAAATSAEPKAAQNPVPDRPFQNLVNRQNAGSPPAAISVPAPAFLPEPSETSWLANHRLLVISAAIVIAATVAFWLLR